MFYENKCGIEDTTENKCEIEDTKTSVELKMPPLLTARPQTQNPAFTAIQKKCREVYA